MNVSKPVIPREVADAIESFRKDGWENVRIISIATGNGMGVTQRASAIKAYAGGHFDTLLAALVNGYDVERSAEELAHDKIRERYMEHFGRERYAGHITESRVAQAYMDGMKFVLNTLKIDVKGVNV